MIAGALTRLFTVIAPRAALTMTAAGHGIGYQSQAIDLSTMEGVAVEAAIPAADPVPDYTLSTDEPIPAAALELLDLSGDLPTKGTYPRRDVTIVTGRVWHHTASAEGTTWSAIARGHIQGRGWSGIGYHIGVDRDGRIAILNQLDRVSNHTAGHNTRNVGCVLLGNYDVQRLTPRMEAGIEMVRRHLDGIGIRKELLHRDTKATACPGRYAVQYLRGT